MLEALNQNQVAEEMAQLNSLWNNSGAAVIFREFKFDDFKSALIFVNQIGQIAEDQNHHPDIELSYGRVKICLSTHSVNGLSKNDFIFARKIDETT